jgi:hypothetical protein
MKGKQGATVAASVILSLLSLSFMAAAQETGAHYFKVDLTNHLTEATKCPDRTNYVDVLKWEIKTWRRLHNRRNIYAYNLFERSKYKNISRKYGYS